MKTPLAACCGLVALLAFAAHEGSAAEPPADAAARFSGHWVLDEKASDDLLAAAPPRTDSGRNSQGGGGGMRGGGVGGGMGRHGGGMKGGRQGMNGDRPRGGTSGSRLTEQERLRRRQAVSRLEIFTDGRELDITDGLDMTRLLSCDGKQKEIWTGNGQVMATARLENGRLIETWSGTRGAGRTRIYTLNADGTRLTIQERRTRPGSDAPVTLTLVYDRRP